MSNESMTIECMTRRQTTMPRLGRTILPDYPHHIVQRGHNRQVVFSRHTMCNGGGY